LFCIPGVMWLLIDARWRERAARPAELQLAGVGESVTRGLSD